jgi:hypothetical protein
MWLAILWKRSGGVFHGDGSHRSAIRGRQSPGVSGASVTFEPGARTAWHNRLDHGRWKKSFEDRIIGRSMYPKKGASWIST